MLPGLSLPLSPPTGASRFLHPVRREVVMGEEGTWGEVGTHQYSGGTEAGGSLSDWLSLPSSGTGFQSSGGQWSPEDTQSPGTQEKMLSLHHQIGEPPRKTTVLRHPRWSKGGAFELPMQGARVQSLVRELDSTCHN